MAHRTIPYHLGRHRMLRTLLGPASVVTQCACPLDWEGRESTRCRWCMAPGIILL